MIAAYLLANVVVVVVVVVPKPKPIVVLLPNDKSDGAAAAETFVWKPLNAGSDVGGVQPNAIPAPGALRTHIIYFTGKWYTRHIDREHFKYYLVVVAPRPKPSVGVLVVWAPYGGALKPNDKFGAGAATAGVAAVAPGVPKPNAIHIHSNQELNTF